MVSFREMCDSNNGELGVRRWGGGGGGVHLGELE